MSVKLDSFYAELEKISSDDAFTNASEIIGLGTLALPSITHMAPARLPALTRFAAKYYHPLELAGLGILALPAIKSIVASIKLPRKNRANTFKF